MNLALIITHKDGSVFPLHLGYKTKKEAHRALEWQKIGQGAWDNISIIDTASLEPLIYNGKLRLDCFVISAQAERIDYIRKIAQTK